MTNTSALNSTELSASINGPAAAVQTARGHFVAAGDFKDTEFLLTAGQAAQIRVASSISLSRHRTRQMRNTWALLANAMDDAQQFV